MISPNPKSKIQNPKSRRRAAALALVAALSALGAVSVGRAQEPKPSSGATGGPDLRIQNPAKKGYVTPGGEGRTFQQFDAYLTRLEDATYANFWSALDFSSEAGYSASLAPYRQSFLNALGIPPALQGKSATTLVSARLFRRTADVDVYRWTLSIGDTGILQEALVGVPTKRKTPLPVVVAFNGNAGSPEYVFGFKQDYHNSFGMALAKEGYMVYSPYLITDEDLRRRLDNRAIGVGMRLVGLEIGIAMRVVDYLSKRKDANPAAINVYGISNGGLLSSYLGAADPRINVTVESGAFVDPNSYFKVYADDNPAYYRYPGDETVFTRATVPYLIAPRPFFVEYGAQDFIVPFHIPEAFQRVQDVYRRLGVEDRAGIGASRGGHQVYLKGSLDFLKQWSPPAIPSSSGSR